MPFVCKPVLTCCGAGLHSVTLLVGERRVLLRVTRVLLVLTVGGVRVVRVVRCLAMVVLVVVAAAASRTRRVLVGAGGAGLLTRVTGHTHQTCLGKKNIKTHEILKNGAKMMEKTPFFHYNSSTK